MRIRFLSPTLILFRNLPLNTSLSMDNKNLSSDTSQYSRGKTKKSTKEKFVSVTKRDILSDDVLTSDTPKKSKRSKRNSREKDSFLHVTKVDDVRIIHQLELLRQNCKYPTVV